MFAFECAAKMACRLELLSRPVSAQDRQALSLLLQSDNNRCPGAPVKAIPTAITDLLRKAEQLRDDSLLGLWSLAREEIRSDLAEDQRQWLAELVRRSLPRAAIEAVFGFERAEMLQLIGCEEVVRETANQQALGLSDNHLHSGAADELGSILERLVPRVVEPVEPRGLEKTAGSVNGAELNAAALVLGLAASCATLSDDSRKAEDQGLADSAWWSSTAQAVHAGSALGESSFKTIREPIEDYARESGMGPRVSDLYSALGEITRGENLTAARLQAARRGLVCLALLHNLISVPPGESLGTFVPRFQLMQSVRDLFGRDYGRLTSALRTMYLENGITAVELRKSIVPGRERTISIAAIKSSIDAAIEEHAREAADACEELELNDLLVRMPVTFTRRDRTPVDTAAEAADFLPFREPIGETLAVADAIVCATEEDLPSRFVGAVDVVGDEMEVANWVYAVAFQRIAKADASSLEFACHAGEYFSDQIEGVRRVAEVALFEPAKVRRIGHCLSLGTDQGAEGGAGRRAEALLENAIWVLLVLEGRTEVGLECFPLEVAASLKRRLKDGILQIAPRVFGVPSVRLPDLRHWYIGRFDIDTVARWIPDLEETQPEEGNYWLRGAPRSSLPTPSSLRDAMVAATIYDGAFPAETSSGNFRVRYDPAVQIPTALRARVDQLLAESAQYVVAPVREWLKGSGIVIESCPSSNTALAGFKAADHPVWKFHAEELRCSINTDDPALFGASLSEEYVYAGMTSRSQGGDGEAFVAALAETSRTDGMIQRPLCDGCRPIEVYRDLAPA